MNLKIGQSIIIAEDWLEKKVKNPKTGNMVKIKSLPAEEREKYRPKEHKRIDKLEDEYKSIVKQRRDLEAPYTKSKKPYDEWFSGQSDEKKKEITKLKKKAENIDKKMSKIMDSK